MNTKSFVKIDSHAHITSEDLYPDVHNIIERAQEENVSAIININTDWTTLQRGLDLQKKYPNYVYNTVATTPHDVEKEGDQFFSQFYDVISNKQVVAVGETGFDTYYEHSNVECQRKFCRKYFQAAVDNDLPAIIHCRGDQAFVELFTLAREFSSLRAVLHCFTGTENQAKQVLDQGWLISISGIITFPKAEELRSVVQKVPLDSLIIETDAPYLAPKSKRGKKNEPSFVTEVGEVLSQVLQKEEQEVFTQTTENSMKFFGISQNLQKK